MLQDLPDTLTTPRLVLRAPTERDGDLLRAAITDSLHRLAPQLTWARRLLDDGGEVPDLARSAAAAAARFRGGEEPSYYVLLAEDPEQMVGELLLRAAGDGRVELGIWIRTGHQGQGYAREACQASVDLLRERGVRGLMADCRADNASATRLLEAAGFALAQTRGDRAVYHRDLG